MEQFYSWQDSIGKTKENEKEEQVKCIDELLKSIKKTVSEMKEKERKEVELLHNRLAKVQSSDSPYQPVEAVIGTSVIEKFNMTFDNVFPTTMKNLVSREQSTCSSDGNIDDKARLKAEECLRDISNGAMEFCAKEASLQRLSLATSVELKEEFHKHDPRGKYCDFQRDMAELLTPSVVQKYMDDRFKKNNESRDGETREFTKQVVELCWLLCVERDEMTFIWSMDQFHEETKKTNIIKDRKKREEYRSLLFESPEGTCKDAVKPALVRWSPHGPEVVEKGRFDTTLAFKDDHFHREGKSGGTVKEQKDGESHCQRSPSGDNVKTDDVEQSKESQKDSEKEDTQKQADVEKVKKSGKIKEGKNETDKDKNLEKINF